MIIPRNSTPRIGLEIEGLSVATTKAAELTIKQNGTVIRRYPADIDSDNNIVFADLTQEETKRLCPDKKAEVQARFFCGDDTVIPTEIVTIDIYDSLSEVVLHDSQG